MGLDTDPGRPTSRRTGTPTLQTDRYKRSEGKTKVTHSEGENTDEGEEPTHSGLSDGAENDDELSSPLALQRALREVEATVDAELVDLLEGLESLREKEDVFQEKLEQLYLELGTIQDELATNAGVIRKTLNKRRDLGRRRFDLQATAVSRTLLTEAAELETRNAAWQKRMKETESRVRAFKDDPALASELDEFRKLDERMDTLELLPDTYQGVVKAHHAELKKKLRPHLEPPAPPEHQLLRLGVAVAVSTGSDGNGNSGRLLAVLPVSFATHARAREGRKDLMARFGFRVLAALSRFVVNIGARTDPKPVDLGGLLGIELPFADLDIPVAPADLARALRESFADAQDPQMRKVSVTTDMVFVPTMTLELLWKRAETSRTPTTKSRGRIKKGTRK
jgi:hypothetical protein